MGTTTEYGNWAKYSNELDVQQGVEATLGEHVGDYDIAALTEAYRSAINAELEIAGISLSGNTFYGPYPQIAERAELITEAIAAVDIGAIVRRFDNSMP